MTVFDAQAITRPDPLLLRYYLLMALAAGPGWPLAALPLVFRYVSLRYRFDDEGLQVSSGVWFTQEIVLTYARIQDIHVSRNLLQRWMGLATLSVQTASGSAAAEITIEGVLEPDALRDFLYTRMRGARGAHADRPADDALVVLREIRDLLAAREPR